MFEMAEEMYVGLRVKYSLFLSSFNQNLSTKISETRKYQTSLKSVQQILSCLVHTNRQGEILIGTNWNVNTPEKDLVQYFKLYTALT